MERRRGVRVPVRLWTRIAGVDHDWQLRRGDVSMSGVYFAVDREVGEPGSLQRIGISSYDRAETAEVMARIVRVSTVHDLWRGPAVTGIAFEFLPETADSRAELEPVIRAAIGAESQVAESLRFDYHIEAQIERQTHEDGAASGALLGVKSMELETGWKIEVGETVHCQISAPASERKIAVSGRATACAPIESKDERYRVTVEFEAEADVALIAAAEQEASGTSIGDAMELLLEEALFPDVGDAPKRQREHLEGMLSRIPLPSLLAFFELERMTGALNIKRDETQACVYLREGRVIDAALPGIERDPTAALAKIVGWDHGDFEFSVEEVDRPDVFDTSTSALLLELAKDQDETTKAS